MRALVSRGLLLPPLVCAALVLGPAGVAAAETRPGTPDTRATELLLPGTGTTPERLRVPADAEKGDAFAPLLTLLTGLTGLTGTGQGTLDAAVAAEQAQAVEKTTALLQEQLRDTADVMTPDAMTPEGTAADSAPAVGTTADAPTRDAAADLQASVDSLVSSLTALDVGGVVGAVPKVLSSVLGLLTGVPGGGLPRFSTPTTT